MSKSTIIIVAILVAIFVFGAIQIIKDYSVEGITGGAISGDFNIEEVSKAEEPLVTSLLSTTDNKLFSDELNKILNKDDSYVVVKQTTIPARKGDHKLYMEWDQDLMVLALYMRKSDNGDATFEIYSYNNKKIASGELTNEFKWYTFDVSSKDMSSSRYALFNYGGGSADIYVDYVLGVKYPEGGLTKVTGLVSGLDNN